VSEITVVGSFFMITTQAVLKGLYADLSKVRICRGGKENEKKYHTN
jgi:hypothetical protein